MVYKSTQCSACACYFKNERLMNDNGCFRLQPDVQQAVHGRFMDQSVSVREAAVDLVGRFLVVQRDLTAQYYDMLSDRILVRLKFDVIIGS